VKERRKVFFSEEKKQKTFNLWQLDLAGDFSVLVFREEGNVT
jgi:hypothetical protein